MCSFAYVTFASAADADNAIVRLNDKPLGSREVRVEKSKPAEAKPPREPRAPRPERAVAAGGAGASSAEPPRYYEERVVVRGLPRDFDVEALKTAFTSVGSVLKSRIGGGVGRLTFASAEEAQRAIGLSGTVVEVSTLACLCAQLSSCSNTGFAVHKALIVSLLVLVV